MTVNDIVRVKLSPDAACNFFPEEMTKICTFHSAAIGKLCVCITKIVDEGQLQASQVLQMCF